MAAQDTMTQWDLADRQALQLELSSAATVTKPLRRAAAALTAMLLALGARYADDQGQIPPQRQAEIRAALDTALAGLAVDVAAETTRAVAAATALAVRQETRALRALGIDAKRLRLRIADPVLTQAGQSSTRVLAAAIGDAQRFAASVPLASVAQLEAVAAKAAGIAPRVEANVRFLTNRAINETTRQLAREATTLALPPVSPFVRPALPEPPGGSSIVPPPLEPSRPPLVPSELRLVWVAERNACCVPGTRVSAPSLLGPGTPAGLVSQDEPQGLPLDPPSPRMGLRGDSSALAASTVAEAVGDLDDVLGVSERDYVGQVITIITASGKEFTGTPNHPVATRRGWRALTELKVGDHVFSRRGSDRGAAGVDPDLYDVEPCIEEVAQAFQLEVPTRVMPVASEDFHGDGSGTQVGVVWAHRLLRGGNDPALGEQLREEDLGCTDVQAPGFDGARPLDLGGEAHRAPSVSGRRSRGNGSSPVGGKLMGTAEVTASGNAIALKPAAHRIHVDAIDYGDFLGCLAILVEPDEVVDIRFSEFRGHVYNLETVEGWYLSEGIVSHNCLTCLALSGHVSDPNQGIGFDEDATFSPHGAPPVWPPGMPLLAPPRHPNCRCRLRIITADNTLVPETLRLNAQRSVLRGFSGSDSNRSRMTAARRLLAHGTGLPSAVHERATRDLARGRFTKPRGPLAKRRYPQSR